MLNRYTTIILFNLVFSLSAFTFTPRQALQELKDGNERFISGMTDKRDLLAQLAAAKKQTPFALILTCMDSRVSPEIIFDQGIGDIFVERLAGNVINEDVLGGMEYGSELSSAKLIAVIGHTSCGAVHGACEEVVDGKNLTHLLSKIKPAVAKVKKEQPHLSCDDTAAVNEIARQNVFNAIDQIKVESPVIMSLIQQGKLGLVGGMTDLGTGKVTFFEDDALLP